VAAEFVISAYHQLFQIKKSFWMPKRDLSDPARPPPQCDSVDAHLIMLFAALALSRWIEHQTGRSIRKFVKTARHAPHHPVQADDHTNTATNTIPDDLRAGLTKIRNVLDGEH
jgi:hypothetical protein